MGRGLKSMIRNYIFFVCVVLFVLVEKIIFCARCYLLLCYLPELSRKVVKVIALSRSRPQSLHPLKRELSFEIKEFRAPCYQDFFLLSYSVCFVYFIAFLFFSTFIRRFYGKINEFLESELVQENK